MFVHLLSTKANPFLLVVLEVQLFFILSILIFRVCQLSQMSLEHNNLSHLLMITLGFFSLNKSMMSVLFFYSFSPQLRLNLESIFINSGPGLFQSDSNSILIEGEDNP